MNATTQTLPGWLQEFDEDYRSPSALTTAAGFQDMSWHNDVCPRFQMIISPEVSLTIWAQPENPEIREIKNGRFTATLECMNDHEPEYKVMMAADDTGIDWSQHNGRDIELYHGDDVIAAIAECHRVAAICGRFYNDPEYLHV